VNKVPLEGAAGVMTLACMQATAYNPVLTIDASRIYFTVLPGGIYKLPK
jgi:hypothetical protein